MERNNHGKAESQYSDRGFRDYASGGEAKEYSDAGNAVDHDGKGQTTDSRRV